MVSNPVATEHLGPCRGAAPQATPDLLTEGLWAGPAVHPHAAQVAGAGWTPAALKADGREDRPPGRPRAPAGLGEGTRVCVLWGGRPRERRRQETRPRAHCGDGAARGF